MSEQGRVRSGLSIRSKAVLVLVLVALVPGAIVFWRLFTESKSAVETGQQQLQASVLSEVRSAVEQRMRETERDARSVANALALAATRDDANLDSVRAMVSSLSAVRAVRFEVPEAKVNTVLHQQREGRTVPASTPELRKLADQRGIAFRSGGEGGAILVVPVPKVDKQGASGYVVVRPDLTPLDAVLSELAEARFDGGGTCLLVADDQRRIVASHCEPTLALGSSVDKLPVWRLLPDGTPWRSRASVVSEFDAEGTAMVGGVETVERLGWGVALFRPRLQAYAVLSRLERTALLLAGAVFVFALLAGLLVGNALVRPVMALVEQSKLIAQRKWRALRPTAPRRDELGVLSRTMTKMAVDLEAGEAEIKHQENLRGNLSRFLNHELVDAIVKGEHSLALGGKRQDISVVFADVVAFTPLSESRAPEEVVSILNELFGMLSEIVFRHEGTVDKFIGDCIMAVWGAPVEQPDHAVRAVMAAEDMLRFLETANDDFREKYDAEIRLGVGINSGQAIVGNIGSEKRMEYTVIGDIVNVAARLETIAAPGQILVAENTQRLVQDEFALTRLGEQKLTGRSDSTAVYQLELDL